jgi:hypothetical protein
VLTEHVHAWGRQPEVDELEPFFRGHVGSNDALRCACGAWAFAHWTRKSGRQVTQHSKRMCTKLEQAWLKLQKSA